MIYAIINQKGGVGKSTTTAILAAALARRGYKVLAVDMDSQSASLSFLFNANNSDRNAAELMKGAPVEDQIMHVADNIDIIAGSAELADIDNRISKARQLNKYGLLKKALQEIQGDYTHILIDTPPSLNTAALNVLVAADRVIIPTGADALSLKGTTDLYETISAVKEAQNPDLQIEGLLITRYAGRTNLAKDLTETAEELARYMHTKVYKTKIRELTQIKESQTLRQSIFDRKRYAEAANDFNAFTDELLSDEKAAK